MTDTSNPQNPFTASDPVDPTSPDPTEPGAPGPTEPVAPNPDEPLAPHPEEPLAPYPVEPTAPNPSEPGAPIAPQAGSPGLGALAEDVAHPFDQTNGIVEGLEGDADDPNVVADRIGEPEEGVWPLPGIRRDDRDRDEELTEPDQP